MPYRFVDGVAIADVTFEATGSTLEELFESAANAVTASMVDDLKTIEQKITKKISISGKDPERLLHNFMQELLFYKDSECLVFSKYTIKIIGNSLEAELAGEELDQEKHEWITDVKAVSWHMYKLEKTEEGWKAFVILDV